MTDLAADLGDYEDEAPVISPPAEDEARCPADDIAAMFEAAQHAAMTPKPQLKEMIEAVSIAASDLEEAQRRLLLTGASDRPYALYMRRAAALVATRNFLCLVQVNQAAVKRVLRGNG